MHASQQSNEERLALDLSRRKHFRVECKFQARFTILGGGEPVEGTATIRNLGLGGARIDCPIDLPMPCDLKVFLPASDVSPELVLDCRVAWSVAERGECPFPAGLQILNVDAAKRKALFRYVAALMR